jgi:hypothetical protein
LLCGVTVVTVVGLAAHAAAVRPAHALRHE